MLVDEPFRYEVTEFDQEVFRRFVPRDHRLVAVEREIDWEGFRSALEAFYSPNMGQPAIDPVRMLKLEFLRYWYNLSDRQVIDRVTTDLACRFLLQVGHTFRPPDFSLLCRFRARLGTEGFRTIFDELVAQARQAGLVKDRLRLKDASHVVASIAVPTALALVAQIRDRLLSAIEPFDAEWVVGQRIEADLMRQRTAEQPDEGRLETRVTHLRELVAWAEELSLAAEPANVALASAWQKFQDTLALAQKILRDRDEPTAGRKTLSTSDPDARRGKHGIWYEGYLVDIMMDADSGLITQIQVLEAGGNEARDAVELVRGEQAAHGNQIESLSIDGAGYNGEVLRTLEGAADEPDDHGLGVTTYVPPKADAANGRFTPDDFTLNEDGAAVTCPAGNTSQYRQRDTRRQASIFRFTRETCDACPLQRQCVAKPKQGAFGRSVTKNDHEGEYRRCRERAKTEAFASVRREHPAVERKLNEMMNHHDGRHARYWGQPKILIQELMTGLAVNIKRILNLTAGVRAEAAASALQTL